MSDGLVERFRHTHLKSHFTSVTEKDFTDRLPDCGPLNIKDLHKFKKNSKAIFYEKWAKPNHYFKKTASLGDFVKLRFIGSGAFGSVALVKEKASQHLYALKCVNKKEVIKNHQLENLKTEQLILQCINHPFTIYLLHTFKDNSYIYFVLPFIEGGDLYGHLKRIGQGHESRAKFYASQVILALEYLHYLDFVYRDLKPENVLMDHTGYLKLADFGFTKPLKRRLRTYTLCGTPEYIAPEIVLSKGYGKSVDWWATGCFIYELVAGQTPFVASDPVRIYENILSRQLKFPKSFSPELRELIDKLLQTDLTKRYGNLRNGVADIKEHKWLVSINWMAIFNRMVVAPYKPKRHSLDLGETKHLRLPRENEENQFSHEFADF